MARPQKAGLDYFPLDTAWDRKMKLLKAKYKLLGVGCIVELYRAIYREGYALPWDEDTRLLFADEHDIASTLLDEIVAFAVEKGVFDGRILAAEGVLTSRGIQQRWKKITSSSGRSLTAIPAALDLLGVSSPGNPADEEFPPQETPAPVGLTPQETPQSKVKESKGNKTEEPREESPLDPTPGTPAVLVEWTRRRNAETGRPLGYADSDRREALSLMARLGGDEPRALAAVESYFANWRDLWFAVEKATARYPPKQRKPAFSFASFARHFEEVEAKIENTTGKEDGFDDIPF